MHPILFKIGPIVIYTYGLFAFLGVVLGSMVAFQEAKKQGIAKETFSNIIFWVVVTGFLGAKLLYILIEFENFTKYPLEMVRSGFVFYGGVIVGVSSLYMLAKKYALPFLKLADTIVVGVPLGHAFGRIGCFFYGCCYGKQTDSFLGVIFPPSSPAGVFGAKIIPTQIISAFFLFLIFLLILFVKKRKKFQGQLLIFYIITYGIFRFIIEFFRGDPRGQFFMLSTSQWISIFFIFLGIFYFYRLSRSA